MNPIRWIRRKALMWAASIADKRSSLAMYAAANALEMGVKTLFFKHMIDCENHKIRARAYRAKAEGLK
jgi:hypothetical protein